MNIPDEVAVLKSMGFIVLQFNPLLWRIRGDGFDNMPYMEWWPMLKKYKLQWSYDKKALAYEHEDEIYAIVKQHLRPFETPTDEQREAIEIWREGLASLLVRFPQLFACGR